MTDLSTMSVVSLPQAERVGDGDTLLLIHNEEDGSQKCYRVVGSNFKGEDAYDIARKNGFSGTYEEWVTEVNKTTEVAAAVDDAKAATANANAAAGRVDESINNAHTATSTANTAAQTANTAAANADRATEASKVQTALSEELNAHPQKQGENGNWWRWDTVQKAYVDTGIIARGGAMYPTFRHEGNKLYVDDYGSNISERVVKEGNKLVFRV